MHALPCVQLTNLIVTSHFTQLRGREHGEQQLATAADDKVHAGGEGLLQDADEV